MYVLFLLGFRFGDRDWNADDMAIAGRELDLDNMELGMGGGGRGPRVVLCCGYWYLVFGGYTRPARSVSGKKAGRADNRHSCRARKNGAGLEGSSNSELHIQINQHSVPSYNSSNFNILPSSDPSSRLLQIPTLRYIFRLTPHLQPHMFSTYATPT